MNDLDDVVRTWLADEPDEKKQRLLSAAHGLLAETGRQTEWRKMCNPWGVVGKKGGSKKGLAEIRADYK